ncbi:hypothetical protein [Ferrimicrobium sp.]|uniref:hypothetical protein n=1 Tax=Ferrimicrobium sp. TaxID=2926050 RepID=UPI0026185012|nr:hypothetical protein [Ferrimicrobium sp.]
MNDALALEKADSFEPFFGAPIPITNLTEFAGWPAGCAHEVNRGEGAGGNRARRYWFPPFGRTNTFAFGPIPVTNNLRFGVTANP